jgi:hypothetical protein
MVSDVSLTDDGITVFLYTDTSAASFFEVMVSVSPSMLI